MKKPTPHIYQAAVPHGVISSSLVAHMIYFFMGPILLLYFPQIYLFLFSMSSFPLLLYGLVSIECSIIDIVIRLQITMNILIQVIIMCILIPLGTSMIIH